MPARRKIGWLTFWVAAMGAGSSFAASADNAAEALREADAICRTDNGSLWGVSLCGPVLLVDPATRSVFANEPDAENQLKSNGTHFVGTVPPQINIANTATEWAGKKWTMIMLPLPKEKERRAALMAHEMWHRIQDQLGIPQSGAANNHLDLRDGRYWLQLEWRALAAALRAKGGAKKEAELDAALFRARRRQLFPHAAQSETEMELSEGLAEYTGVKLSGARDPARFVIEGELKEAPNKGSFVRSFAYATGPAYGLLLDATGDDWRKQLKGRDLSELLMERAAIKLPEDAEAAANDRAKKYGGAEIAATEARRDKAQRDVAQTYHAKFVEGPVLIVPLQKMNMQFNPGNLVPLEPFGTVYPDIRIVDAWGILTVSKGGALMSSDFSRITVPAPKTTSGELIEGDGWSLHLNAGWLVRPGERPGDFTVRPLN